MEKNEIKVGKGQVFEKRGFFTRTEVILKIYTGMSRLITNTWLEPLGVLNLSHPYLFQTYVRLLECVALV